MDYILDQCRNLVFYIKQNYKNPDLIEEIKFGKFTNKNPVEIIDIFYSKHLGISYFKK